MNPDTSAILSNLSEILTVVSDFAIIAGLMIFLNGLLHLKKHGEARGMGGGEHSLGKPLMMIFSGCVLLLLPTMISSMLEVFYDSSSPLAYSGTGGDDGNIEVIVYCIRIFGVCAFIKGVIHLARAGGHSSQPGTVGRAMVHMFGGILCINIVATIGFVQNIFF